MIPRLILTVLGLFTVLSLANAEPDQSTSLPAPSRPPNIVLLYADDLGYGDLGYMGSKDVKTPNIDALARRGVVCTDAYMTAPQCSPSRAALLTGRYQQRFGYEHIAPTHTGGGLPHDEKTIPEYLHQAGYHCGIIGKWHLGSLLSQHPKEYGFDEFYGFLHGTHDYYRTREDAPNESHLALLFDNDARVSFDGYLTDDLAEKAVAFIERNTEKPFFLYLPFNAPHTPLQAPPEHYQDAVSGELGQERADYLGMVAALDAAVGRIVSGIEQAGIADNTLVIFTNDNGGVSNRGGTPGEADNGPLRGAKGLLFEGGIRVPWVFYWPGTLKPHVYSQPITGVDIAPTLLSLASVPIPDNLDGVSLWPSIETGISLNRDYLYWRFKFRGRIQGAVRKGDWKYYKVDRGDGPTPYGNIIPAEYLFNLHEDIAEQNDVALQNPEVFEELRSAYTHWDSQLAEPAWPSD